jgi:hypothetical protein
MDSQRGQSDLPADDKILIVAETDSASKSWMAIGPDERDEAVAIFQQLGEPDAEFARRAAARIRRLENARFRPRRAIFALRTRCSESASRARVLIARSLVAALCNAGGVELVLAANSRFADSSRHELLGMVEALTFSLPGRPIDIRADFSAAASVHPLRSVSGVPPALEPRRPLRAAEGWS